MPLADGIVSSPVLESRILAALLMLLSLKGIAKGFIIGSVFTVCLFFYSMLIDALYEITSHIAALWTTSDSITRLLMLCLAVYVARKMSPYAVKLCRKGF